MSMTVSNKRVFVTGGARGIGAAVVSYLAAEGANVASVDVTEDSGEEVARKSNAAGPGTAVFRRTDVTDSADVRSAVDWAREQLGGLDAVVNVAGVERRALAEDIPEAELDFILNVNVKGVINVCQAAFPALREHGGSVINFGSDAGLAPYPGGAHYAASKGAVLSYTRTIAAEWGRYGIRANSVTPAIQTDMYKEYRARLTPDQLAEHDAQMAQLIPLGGKLGDLDTDIAPPVAFLVSDASKFITAQIISVNGGLGQVR